MFCDDILLQSFKCMNICQTIFFLKQFKLYFLRSVQMYLNLKPVKLALEAKVAMNVDLGFVQFQRELFRSTLWDYKSPTIQRLLIDLKKQEQDQTPPEIRSFGVQCFFLKNI